jgi:hypothetical protein
MTSSTLKTESSKRMSGTATAVRSASTANSSNQTSGSKTAPKYQYPVDQQLKFLHLQAETETLLQHLQVMKQQRQSVLN